jgi:hypothetical protein
VIPCADPCDAWALAALLNSRLAAAWLNAIAEPARGGYRRYLGWTVGLLPLPREWGRARAVLARAGKAASRGADVGDVDKAVAAAYGLSAPEWAPLADFAPCT